MSHRPFVHADETTFNIELNSESSFELNFPGRLSLMKECTITQHEECGAQ